jgi:hypothetical protein
MLNARIAPSTHSGYNSMKICFFPDNCEKFPDIIHPDLMGNRVVADDKDHQHRTKAGKPLNRCDYSKQTIHLHVHSNRYIFWMIFNFFVSGL